MRSGEEMSQRNNRHIKQKFKSTYFKVHRYVHFLKGKIEFVTITRVPVILLFMYFFLLYTNLTQITETNRRLVPRHACCDFLVLFSSLTQPTGSLV